MSRFYNTSRGKYKDFMFKPNYELMERVAAKKEFEVDTTLAESQDIVNAYSNVKYIPIEAERKRVEDKKNYYDKKATEITNQVLDNVLDASSYMPDVNSLKQELTEDLTTGETSKIVGRYNSFQKMLKENEELKETDPTTYNQMMDFYYNQFKEGVTASGDYQFNPQKFVGRPDLFKKELTSMMDKIKAHRHPTKAGHYIYDQKEVSEARVRQIALNMVMSDPKYQGYMQQQIMIGEGQGFISGTADEFMNATNEERAKMMVKPVVLYNNATGEEITQDDYDKLTDKEKASVIAKTNEEYRFASDLNTLQGIYAFRETEMKVDNAAVQAANRGSRERITRMKEAAANARLEAKFANEKERDEWKAAKEAELIVLENGGSVEEAAAASAALNQDAALELAEKDPANNELAQGLPGVSIGATKDRENLLALEAAGKVKKVRGEDGVMRFEAEPGSEAHEIIARQRMAREKLIASVDKKGEDVVIKGTDGKSYRFPKVEIYRKHGDREFSKEAIERTITQIAKDNNLGILTENEKFEANPASPSGGDYVKTKSTIGTRNIDLVESLATFGYETLNEYYNENVSTNTTKEYIYNTVAQEQSDNILEQMKLTPEAFDFFTKDGTPYAGKTLDGLTKTKLNVLNAVETPLDVTGVNVHASSAFKLEDGTIIIPDKTHKTHELVTNLALAGTNPDDSFIHQNKLEADAERLFQTMGKVGAVNGEKLLTGWVHPASGEDYRIYEYYDEKQGKTQIAVLDPAKSEPVFKKPFNNYKEALEALNTKNKKSK